MTPTLLLFDIDGTLLTMPGCGMKALGRAVRDTLGFDFQDSGIRPDGRTDPLIVTELLLLKKFSMGRWKEIESEVWDLYSAYLTEDLTVPDERRRLAPGVADLLERLSTDPRFRLGLLTGNLEATAHIKLDHFGLKRYFPIGAFGSDCAERCRLGRVALERARRYFGMSFLPESTWVIGDTEHDVRAGRSLGARVLAVATGNYSLPFLEEFCPDATLADLSDTDLVVRILAGT